MAQYDAKQLYYLQFSNRGEKFDVAADPEITLYNEYFGGGMNTIVFQEMREARGLAYSASAYIMQPHYGDMKYGYMAFIATQNDKMQTAIEAFDEIINQMPESEAAFKIAKEGVDFAPAHRPHGEGTGAVEFHQAAQHGPRRTATSRSSRRCRR